MIFDFVFDGFRLFFSVILPLASLGGAIFFYRMWRRQSRVARETLRWPSTRGRIQSSGIAEKEGSDSAMFQAEVEYAYQVNGTGYVGQRINLYPFSCSDRRVAERALAKYPAGSEHPIYYDPADPASSLLQPGMTWLGRLPLIASIGLLAGSIVWFVASWHFDQRILRIREAEPPEQRAKDR